MEKKILGRTGFNITRLSYGAMHMSNIEQKTADILFNTALDMGVNYIDTAPEYTNSEEYIGNAIFHRRSEYFIATKCGDYLSGNGPNKLSPNIYYSKEIFTSNIERSLKLLKTDYIDLMQMHGLMPEYLPAGEQDELINLLLDLKKSGKIRYIGASFRSGRPGEELYPAGYGYNCAKAFLDWKVIDSIQIAYGGLTRTNEMAISALSQRGFGIIARSILRKYSSNYDQLFENSKLSDLFEEGEDKNAFLLRFALSHPDITAVIVGTGNVEHLKSNIEVSKRGGLTEEVYMEAKKRLNSIGISPKEF